MHCAYPYLKVHEVEWGSQIPGSWVIVEGSWVVEMGYQALVVGINYPELPPSKPRYR